MLSILRSFDTNGRILDIDAQDHFLLRIHVRAYVRTNLIDVDLRESSISQINVFYYYNGTDIRLQSNSYLNINSI